MTKAPNLPSLTGQYLSTTQVNAAFEAIEEAFQNTLSLDGSTPNSMQADLDMDSNNILNVGLLSADDIAVDGSSVLGVLERSEDAADRAEAAADSAALLIAGSYSVAAFDAVGDGVADDRAAFVAATAAAGADGEIVVPAGTYRIASALTATCRVRFEQGGKIKPDAGTNVHLSRGYVAPDRAWVFDIAAAGSSVTGDVPSENGYITPFHYGALGNGTGDDAPAFMAAIRYATIGPIRQEYAESFPVKVPMPSTYYRAAQTIFVNRTLEIFGEAPSPLRSDMGVEVRGANGLAAVWCFIFPGGVSGTETYKPENPPDHPTAPGFNLTFGAMRARMRYIATRPEVGATVRQGIVHNCVAHFEHCLATGFSEAGWHAHANTSGLATNIFDHPGRSNANNTTVGGTAVIDYSGTGSVFGNVNGSTYHYCMAQNGLMHGFVCHGNNAGTVGYYKCDAAGNAGAGFVDNTSIGSEFVACHSAQNSFKVLHGGVYYICIKAHTSAAASEPGVGANWTTFWRVVTATTADASWALSTFYHPSAGFHVCSANGRASIIGCYSEGGIEAGVVARNTTTVVGGSAAERAFWHPEFGGARVVGPGNAGFQAVSRFRGMRDPNAADTEYGGSWGAPGGFTSGRIAQFGDALDDVVNKDSAVRFGWNSIRGRYEFTDSSNSNRQIFGFSGTGYSGTGYSAITQSYPILNGAYLGDGSAAGLVVSRLFSVANLAGITDATFGAAVRGDKWFYTQPSAAGKIGAVCTTSGVLGSTAVLKEFGAIDA